MHLEVVETKHDNIAASIRLELLFMVWFMYKVLQAAFLFMSLTLKYFETKA